MGFRNALVGHLRPLDRGRLEMVLPDGTVEVFGGKADGVQARIEVQREIFFRRASLFGPIGFAESYMDGDWETPDLARVIAFFILNAEGAKGLETESGAKSGLIKLMNAYNRVLHRRRPNTRSLSRKNIGDHYDLSNDFFELWLDPTMTYSSGIFESADDDLEAAQIRKYERLCERLQICASDHVLEIGTGWGGFSIYAARTRGCRVTTTTISTEQLAMARDRVAEAGLTEQVTLLSEDYRNLTGQYDKIVSIEMIEAVGDKFLDGYFGCCQRLLKPQGLLGLQMIACPDRQYRILRDGVDFIQKHIFPGSLLISLARVTAAVNRTGTLNLLEWADFSPSYARTLMLWCERFEAKLDAVRELGFDERFIRKWRYYLRYCEAAFGTRNISVVQAVFSRPNNLSITSPVYSIIQ